MRAPLVFAATCLLLGPIVRPVAAQDLPDLPIEAPPEAGAPVEVAKATPPPKPGKDDATPAEPSLAEQIGRLQRGIDADKAQLARLKAELDDPDGEYARAEAAFEKADKDLESKRKALKALRDGKQDTRARSLAAEVAQVEKNWKLAKDRFDLAIAERKAFAEQIATLEQKIRRDTEAMSRLDGSAQPEPEPRPDAATDKPAEPPVAESPAATASAPAPAKSDAAPSEPAPPGTAAATPAPAEPAPPRPVDRELVKAREDARTKAAASKKADREAQSATERLASLDKDIALEKALLETARRQHDNAAASRGALADEFRRKSVAGAPRDEVHELAGQLQEADQRLQHAADEVREHSARLDELQSERAEVQAEQIAALRKANQAHEQEKVAEAEIARLQNPFSPHNVLRWAFEHGPRMVVILVAMVALHWVMKLSSRRVIHLIARGGARGTRAEREDRAHTLVGVFHNAASVAIIAGGLLMVLQETGIPIAPLLGGAAVFGLAVAFGAQNLIRDYFYGFVILLENQYKLNDVVKIGGVSGQVERITLRMTVLRDGEGCVHFLPNGQITSVSNMTHGWSRAVFEIGVAYEEDVDRVMAVLLDLCHELRRDDAFGPLILDEPTMQGVEALADSAVVIKFFLKTRTLQQWPVKREMLRRIKNKFDELGIEIPYPHRVVHHRRDDGAGAPAEDLAPHTRPINAKRRPSA